LRCIDLVDTIPFVLLWKDDDDDDEVLGESVEEKIVEEGVDYLTMRDTSSSLLF
jgi:hypothetical protein